MTNPCPAHLVATDESGLALFDTCPDLRPVGVIVPANRAGSEKIARLHAAAAIRGLPVAEQARGGPLPDTLPPAELAVSWMYSQIIPASCLTRYAQGLVNMHGGHIPRYRGANVLQWAMINGEPELWVTWHEIVAEVDAGPIWAEAPLPLPDDWTALQARAAMIDMALALFPQAWQRKRNAAGPVRVPDLTQGRVWPSRRPADSVIESDWDRRRLHDFIRALCPPWPAPVWQGRPVSGFTEQPRAGALPYACADGTQVFLIAGPPS